MKTTIKKLGLLTAMLLAILPISAYDFEIDGIFYNMVSVEDKTCEVTSGENKYKGNVEIPSTIEYKGKTISVVGIRWSAFSSCDDLTSVILPESITYIGSRAFSYCDNLMNLNIPSSVKSIEYGTFTNCKSLKEIILPPNLETIGECAFQGCENLKIVQLPEHLKLIGDLSFADCSSLTEIEIPKEVTRIGRRAFRECNNIIEITIPSSVTDIGCSAFFYCKGLKKVIFEESPNLLKLEYKDEGQLYETEKYPVFYRCYDLSEVVLARNITGICFDLILGNELPHINLTLMGVLDENSLLEFRAPTERIIFSEGFLDINNNVDLSRFYSLESLYVEDKNPPHCPKVNEKQLFELTVYVPNEYIEEYQKAERWCNFWDIQGFEVNSVESVNEDLNKTVIGQYDLSGSRVDENFKGLVIVRFSDGSTKKILQK